MEKATGAIGFAESFFRDGNGSFGWPLGLGGLYYAATSDPSPSAIIMCVGIIIVWWGKSVIHKKNREKENQIHKKNREIENQIYEKLSSQIHTEYEEEARKIVEEEDPDNPLSDEQLTKIAQTCKNRLYGEYNKYNIAKKDSRVIPTSDEISLVVALEKDIKSQSWMFSLKIENQRKRRQDAAEMKAKDDLEPAFTISNGVQQFTCSMCEAKTNLKIDHTFPGYILDSSSSKGLKKYHPLCQRCNAKIFEKRMFEYLRHQPDIESVTPTSLESNLPVDAIIETKDAEIWYVEIKYGEFNKCMKQVEAEWANTGLSIIFTYSYHEYGHYFWSSLPNEEE